MTATDHHPALDGPRELRERLVLGLYGVLGTMCCIFVSSRCMRARHGDLRVWRISAVGGCEKRDGWEGFRSGEKDGSKSLFARSVTEEKKPLKRLHFMDFKDLLGP